MLAALRVLHVDPFHAPAKAAPPNRGTAAHGLSSEADRRPRELDRRLPDGTARSEATTHRDVRPCLPAGHRKVRARSRAEVSSTTPMNRSAAVRWSCPPRRRTSTRQIKDSRRPSGGLFLHPGSGDQQLALQLDRSTLIPAAVADQERETSHSAAALRRERWRSRGPSVTGRAPRGHPSRRTPGRGTAAVTATETSRGGNEVAVPGKAAAR